MNSRDRGSAKYGAVGLRVEEDAMEVYFREHE